VATVIPYDGSPHGAVEIVPRGQGGLVSSVYSEEAAFTSEVVLSRSDATVGLVFGGRSEVLMVDAAASFNHSAEGALDRIRLALFLRSGRLSIILVTHRVVV
jgi:hypothetical protein